MSGLDWNGRLETADNRQALLLPADGVTPYRRVAIQRNGRAIVKWNEAKEVTVWHYNEDGTLNASGPEWALSNPAGEA